MDLVLLSDAAASAYVAGISSHAAVATDSAARSVFSRLRSFLSTHIAEVDQAEVDKEHLSAAILESLRENPEYVQELAELLGIGGQIANIEGAGTVYGDINLRGKYVAGRDIRFDK
ncbi:hypothetical protein [Kitasatospora xanthocidica]|uniref:hypothetical protein n=1 Tax=Kitasatospora xanthocidica TaxID=83382 RepID=UPI0011C3B525|nr:hypothetical protein [Kitasatospora xanthocidica]